MTTVAIWYQGLLSILLIHTGHWHEFCPVHLWGLYVSIYITEVVRVFLWYPYPNLPRSQFIHFFYLPEQCEFGLQEDILFGWICQIV